MIQLQIYDKGEQYHKKFLKVIILTITEYCQELEIEDFILVFGILK